MREESERPGRGRGPTREVLPHARPGPNEAVEREIRHHIEERVERLVEQGMSPEDARAEAERRFGDVDRIRDEVRTVDRRVTPLRTLLTLVDKTARDLRYGVRTAARSPWLSLAIVGTLALAIGANTAIFSLVETVLLRPLPFPEPDRVVDVREVTPEGQAFAVAPANFLDWRERQEVFAAMSPIAGGAALVTEGGPAERVSGVRVFADYFRVFGVEPMLGRTFAPGEDGADAPDVAVVSHAFWVTRLGGDPAVIGRSIRLDGTPHTIIGVMPPGFRTFWYLNPQSPNMVWRPNPFVADPPQERSAKRIGAVARLEDGVTLERARADMESVAEVLGAEYPETNEGWSVRINPLSAVMTWGVRGPVLTLFGAVGFILLIACLNVGGLLLARADARRSAITVRRALGASRADIVRQLLAESVLFSLAATVLGIGLARALIPILVRWSPYNVTFSGDVEINATVLIFTVVAALGTAVGAGVAPALGVSSPDLNQELKDHGLGKTESRRTRRSRSALVVAEITLSVVLVIGAGLMLRSYGRLRGLDLGFQPEGLIRVGALLPRDRYAAVGGKGSHPGTENFTLWRPRPEETEFREGVVEALSALPGVQTAAGGNYDPFPGRIWLAIVRPEGAPPLDPADPHSYSAFRPVTPGWLETLEMPVVAGRALTEADRFGVEDVAVLDENAVARLWPGEPASRVLGRSVILQDGVEDVERPFRIVGVSGATRQTLFDRFSEGGLADQLGVVFVPFRSQAEAYVDWQVSFHLRSVFLVRTDRDLADVAPDVRRVLASFDPELPVTVERLEDTIAGPLSSERFYMWLLVAFGSLALLLASTGTFAVMAYTVTRRTREMGIRLALGARSTELERAELLRGLRLAVLGILLGGIGAAWLARFIAAFLHGVVSQVDPTTYAIVAALVVCVSVLASYLPARRAGSIDPMESLRTE